MSKIKIFSIHAKRTDFLKLHIDSLNHFCKDDFEYFCIDNFVDQEKSNNIKLQCKDIGINYLRFKDYNITGTAWDHSPALNSIKNISNDQDINIILEFDVFLIRHFSFVDYIEQYDISGIYQQRNGFENEYIAPFVIIVNKDSNFSSIDFGSTPGFDVGGNIRFFLPNKNVKWMNHTSSLITINDSNAFNIDYDPSFGCQIIENSFLHYYRGTNWDNRPKNYENLKTSWLLNALHKSKECDILNHTYVSRYSTKFSHAFRYWNGTENMFITKLNPYLNEN